MASGTQSQSDDALESHVRAPTTTRQNTKRVNFSVDTTKAEVFKAEDDDNLNTYLKVPVSSLNEDRDGDEIADDGMDSLLKQVSDEPVGLFPNHGMDPGTAMYDFREVFGAWEDGEMDGDRTFGTVRLKRVAPDSEELVDDAKKLVNAIEQDMPVGFSIGFGWDDKDAEELDSGGMRFHDLDLMEISAVGIPSNPSAVVQAGHTDTAHAMKGFLNHQAKEVTDEQAALARDALDRFTDEHGDASLNDFNRWLWEVSDDEVDSDTVAAAQSIVDEYIQETTPWEEPVSETLDPWLDSEMSDDNDNEDEEEQESKQAGELDDSAVAEFVAGAWDGLDASDLATLADENDAEFVGVDDGELAALVANYTDVSTGDANDAITSLMEMADEETEEEAGDGEDEDEDDEEMEGVAEEIEALRTEVESLKTEMADSAGRKGGMTPADDEGDDPDEGKGGAEPETEYDEAVMAFSED